VLEVKLCGEPQMRYEGKPWKMRLLSSCWPMLALLAMQHQPVSRAKVASLLWPEALDSEASANLRRHLHVIMKELPASEQPWILVDQRKIGWNHAMPARIDVVEFQNLVAQGRDIDAIAIYAGDLLASSFDEAIVEAREQLRASYLKSLERLMSGARIAGDLDTALRYAELLLDADEWREDAVRAVMAIRYEKGDRSGAVAIYERFADALRRELRVQPMSETTVLRDKIVAGEPIADTAVPRTALERDARIKLAGRLDELRTLRSAWTRAARGRGTTILLTGEPGIGKSRLALELCALVEQQRGSALIGRTSSPEAGAFQPVIEALRDGLGLLTPSDVDDVWLAPLAGVLPEIERLRTGELPSVESFGAEGARTRLREALVRLAAAAARRRPLVVVLEDVHWANRDTLELIEMLANRAAGIPLLLVVTYRSGELSSTHPMHAIRRELQHARRAQAIALSRLTEPEIGELAKAVLGPEHLTGAFVERVSAISEGNPLFAVQVLRYFSDTGEMPRGEDALASIAGTVLSRLDRLSPQARAIADIAASIGSDFTIEEIARVGGWEEPAVLDALGRLLDAKIVCQRGGERFGYGFTHALIETAIRQGAERGDVRARHYRIAEVLSSTREDDAASASIVALHWEAADRPAQAANAWLSAARVAMNRYAWNEAVRVARRAIELGLQPQQNFETLCIVIAATFRLADASSIRDELAELESLASSLGSEERLTALLLRAKYADSIADRDPQKRAIDKLLETAERADSDRWRAEAHLLRASFEYSRGRVSEAEAESRTALALARSNGDAELTWRVREAFVQYLFRVGNVEEGRHETEAIRAEADAGNLRALGALVLALARLAAATQDPKLYQVAREYGQRFDENVGDVRLSLIWRNELAYEFQQQWNTAAARTSFEEASTLAKERGLLLVWMVANNNLGCVEREIGNYERARALWMEIRPPARRLKVMTTLACCAMNLAELDLTLERPETAMVEAREAHAHAQQCGVRSYRAEAANLLGAIECRLGQTETGLARLREGLEIRRTLSSARPLANELCVFVEALLDAEKIEEATAAASELRTLFEKDPEHQINPARIALAVAAVARANGKDHEAQKLLERGQRAVEYALSRQNNSADREAFLAMKHNRKILARA
jgi:predicted ATPase/DNA-binding SARP family transcriptional activator